MSPMDREQLEANRRSWDERTPLHERSALYDLEGVVRGRSTLHPFEPAALGDVERRSLLHLQCHIGTDSISWARLGAKVTGLDFSPVAIAAAKELAERCGVEADFVVSDVYEAPSVLGRTFDVVYTGLGALCWLSDLDAWASVVASLLAEGGRFYLLEFHPLLFVLSDEGPVFDSRYSYFHEPGGVEVDDPSDYADSDARLEASVTYEWAHTIGDVVTALIGAGLEIRSLVEHDVIAFKAWPQLVEVAGEAKLWRMPEGEPKIPLEYSLLAIKPGA